MKLFEYDVFYDSLINVPEQIIVYEDDLEDDDNYHLAMFFVMNTFFIKPIIEKRYFKKNIFFKINRNSYYNKIEIDVSFLNMFVKSGMKFKYFKFVNTAIGWLITSLTVKSEYLNDKFTKYSIVRNYFYSNKFISVKFILNHLFNLNYMVFGVFLCKLAKRKKKKNKTKFMRIFKYTKPYKRSSTFLRDMYYYSNKFNYLDIRERIIAALLTLIFLQKESVLYKKKIYAYSKFVKRLIDFE